MFVINDIVRVLPSYDETEKQAGGYTEVAGAIGIVLGRSTDSNGRSMYLVYLPNHSHPIDEIDGYEWNANYWIFLEEELEDADDQIDQELISRYREAIRDTIC